MEGDPTQQAAASTQDMTAADASAEVVDPGVAATEGVVTDASTDAAEGTERTAEAAAPTSDDDADLATYPEAVRDRFKDLAPAERKALYEHAEASAREGWEALKKREAEIEAEQTRKTEQIRQIRAKAGRFVGAEAQTITNPDGTTRDLPSYDELARLSQTRSGRDVLFQKYGLDEADAEGLKAEWDQRYEMLEASADLLEAQRLGQFDQRLRAGFKTVDLDPDAYLGSVTTPEEIIPAVVGMLREQHQAEIKALTTKHADELRLHTSNAEGLRARALAGDAPPMPTGGRTAGSAGMTLEQFRALPLEERRRMRESNPAMVDHLYSQGVRSI